MCIGRVSSWGMCDAEVVSAEKEAVAGLQVMTEFLSRAPQLGHKLLQNPSAHATLEFMQVCSQHGQRSIQILVEALQSPEAGVELVQDAVCVLNKIATPCSTAQQWIRAAGGMKAAQVLLSAHSSTEKCIHHTIWLVHAMEGSKGFVALLQYSQENCRTALSDSAVAGIAWAIYELTKVETAEEDGNAAPEAGDLLRVLVEIMRLRRKSFEVHWCCCSALEALMYKDARLGRLFLELGGGPLLLDVLQRATVLTTKSLQPLPVYLKDVDAEDLARTCAYIVAGLADGSSQHAEMLRRQGAMQVLASLCLRGHGSLDEEAALWALGQLGGLSAVLEAMAQAPKLTNRSAVLRGSMEAIADLTFKNEDVQILPAVLTSLLNIFCQEVNSVDPVKGAGALVTAAIHLSTHFAPGQLPELDRAIEALVHVLRTNHLLNVSVTCAAVEGLGRLALTAPAWREGLRQCGVLELLTMHIRSESGGRRLVKYCFWTAAALAGMPFVVHELHQLLRNEAQTSVNMVDAVLCTIINIMEDDLEHDYVLRGTERCPEASVPDVLRLIAEAMKRYDSEPDLQHHGCTAVALLIPVAPKEKLPPEAITAILAAARGHAKDKNVVGEACRAVRAVVEQYCLKGFGTQNPHADLLVEHGAEGVAQLAIKDLRNDGGSELLEDAFFVLATLKGMEPILKIIKEIEETSLKAAGLKAIFELGRSQPALLKPPLASLVMSAGVTMAQAHPKDGALQRAAQLLVGQCNAMGATLCLQAQP